LDVHDSPLELIFTFDFVSPTESFFEPKRVLGREIWRLVPAVYFVGRVDLAFFVHIFPCLFIVMSFERRFYSQRLSAMVFIFLLIVSIVFVLSGILGSFATAHSILDAFAWLAARHSGDRRFHLPFVIRLPIRWIPFLILLWSVLEHESLVPGMIGVIAGHTVFFMLYIWPVKTGRPVLRTPVILTMLFDRRRETGGRLQGRQVVRAGGGQIGG
jgi:hypothetical protein